MTKLDRSGWKYGKVTRMEPAPRPECEVCGLHVLPGDTVNVVGRRDVEASLVLDSGDNFLMNYTVPRLRHEGCGRSHEE